MHAIRASLCAGLFTLSACVGLTAQAMAQETLSPAPDVDPTAVFSDTERDAIVAVMRDYFLENPEFFEEVVIALNIKREEARIAAFEATLEPKRNAIYADPRDVYIGPADAPVTVVEFFDYNCGFCKQSALWTQSVIETYGDQVRVIFKETPIFAARYESSDYAARAVLAAAEQDAYEALHFALMAHTGALEVETVREIAIAEGLNWTRLKRIMDATKDDAQQHLADTLILADELGLTGTPAYIINDRVVSGADFEALDATLIAALAESGAETP